MIFTRLDTLYIVLPLLLVFAFFMWRSRKSYLSLSMLPYLRNRIRPVSRFVYLPRVLEFFALVLLAIALLNPVQPLAERTIFNRGLDILLVLDLSWSMQEPIDLEVHWKGEEQESRARRSPGSRRSKKSCWASCKNATVIESVWSSSPRMPMSSLP